MSKYSQDFIEVTPQVFCADIINEPTNYKSDVFIAYGKIEKMEIGSIAIVYTRKNGCEFVTDPSMLQDTNPVHYYTIERGGGKILSKINVSKCNYHQAVAFLTAN
jgi:hypothetical protein